MKKVFLGENGPEVSSVIYSFWRALEEPNEINYNAIKSKFLFCLEQGITTFDHADHYGDYQVEKLFGKALKETGVKRNEIIISTKCGTIEVSKSNSDTKIKHYNSTPEHIIKSVENSLKNLQTDYLDILLLQHPDPLMDADETASALTLLVNKGLVKHVGVADYSVHQHQLLQSRLSIPIITNHLEFNVLKTKPLVDGTIDFIKQQYSRPLAWAPLAGGRLIDENDISTYNCRNVLKKIAQKLNYNEEQIAIAWLLKTGALPIVGTNNLQRIKNATSSVHIELSREDWFEIYFSSANSN